VDFSGVALIGVGLRGLGLVFRLIAICQLPFADFQRSLPAQADPRWEEVLTLPFVRQRVNEKRREINENLSAEHIQRKPSHGR
jgi:hypothetical protein